MSRHDFSQQFPSHQDFSQQFPSPNMMNTPPEDIFPVFRQEIEPQNNPPPPNQQRSPPRALTDEELFQQDMEVLREVQEAEEREAAARRAIEK